jgi:hypothetical protein
MGKSLQKIGFKTPFAALPLRLTAISFLIGKNGVKLYIKSGYLAAVSASAETSTPVRIRIFFGTRSNRSPLDSNQSSLYLINAVKENTVAAN